MSRLGNIGGRLYRGEVSVDFVGRQRLWYLISGLILVISIVAVLTRGLNPSVEFKGGSVFQFTAPTASISDVRATIQGAGAPSDSIVQQVSGGKWRVQTKPLPESGRTKVQKAIAARYHLKSADQVSTQFIGATWGSDISKKAVEALIAFLVAIVLYLSIAFEWKMAASALIALAHDIVIAVGLYALVHFEVSPATVIGLLTILGYSLYDTVVVFDKVRENTAGLLGGARTTYSQAANLALNQTLIRSINTSVIALLPVAAILFVGAGLLGAGELKDLALVLFVGMLCGTYSSICIATPVLADLKEREPQYQALARRVAVRESGVRAERKQAKKAKAAVGTSSAVPAAGAAMDNADQDATAGSEETGTTEAATADAAPGGSARSGAPRSRSGQQGQQRRSGQRQQPRRSSAARRRPSGKKKR